MLHEYALEPSLLNNWSDFRFFVSQFGFDRGRLISRFPKKWKRLVYESLGGCKEIERARIEESLRRIDDRLVPRQATAWETTHDWLANAEAEHANHPFWAIIAQSNQRSHSAVIVAATLDDTLDLDALPSADSRRLWKANRSQIIRRNASEMANAVEAFIKHADQILFVDKHFGPENSRHRIPFEEFLSRLRDRRDGKMPKTIEVHCAYKSEASFFRNECNSRLAGIVPKDLRMQVRRWSAVDLHNRFILTDLGGVAFLEGLDHFTGAGREEDVVVLLDQDVSQQLMNNYTVGKTNFVLIDECEVIGTRMLT